MLMVYTKAKVQNWSILGDIKISDFLQGMPDNPDIFGVNRKCWVQAYALRKIVSTPLRLYICAY